MEIRKVEYLDGDILLEATVAYEDKGKKKPVVLVFHAWEGKDPFAEQKAVELAKLGFIGCACDLYGKGIFGRSKQECSALMSPFMADRMLLQKRILAYRELFSLVPEMDEKKVAAIGFCFGGLCALDLARSGAEVKAVVSFHGLLQGDQSLDQGPICAKVLAFHGYKDPMVRPEELLSFSKEMDAKKVDFQLHVFGQAMHAFTNPKANDPSFGTLYDKESDSRSWNGMRVFFQEVFA